MSHCRRDAGSKLNACLKILDLILSGWTFISLIRRLGARVAKLALPKCAESGNLSFNEAIIRRLPEKTRSR